MQSNIKSLRNRFSNISYWRLFSKQFLKEGRQPIRSRSNYIWLAQYTFEFGLANAESCGSSHNRNHQLVNGVRSFLSKIYFLKRSAEGVLTFSCSVLNFWPFGPLVAYSISKYTTRMKNKHKQANQRVTAKYNILFYVLLLFLFLHYH